MSVKETFKELRAVLDKLRTMDVSLNKESPVFQLVSKIVIPEEGLIFRIEDARTIKTRIAFAALAKEVTGISFFLPEKLEEENDLYGISSQIKLKNFEPSPEEYPIILPSVNAEFGAQTDAGWERILALRTYHDYGEETYKKLTDFCRQWRVIFIHDGNVGLSATNKIQCFDYAANIALNQKGQITDGAEVNKTI